MHVRGRLNLLALGFSLCACGGSNPPAPPPIDATTGCVSDTQCVDDSECTLDQCVEGVCMNTPQLEGEPCDDGLACTTLERCAAGVCEGEPLDCSSLGDVCNVGTCSESAGGCVLDPVDDGTPCDDGFFCTENDSCTAGTCDGDARDCSPFADDCNAGTCDETTASCVATPVVDGTPCDDGLFCTEVDECSAGTCAGTTPRDCSSASDACNAGTCDESGDACVPTPANEGGPCDDGLYCTDVDACVAGVCGGSPRDCSTAADACNVGTCDETVDACLPTPANEGDPCDDGLTCTVNDACASGTCGGAPRDCTAFANACNAGVCDESVGCVSQPTNEGLSCDDGLYCTLGDACASGVCASTMTRSCADTNACTTDSCDEGSDTCTNDPVPPIPGAEGPPGDATCADGVDNDCDGTTDLADANCVGCVTPADCDDLNPCTADSCSGGVCSNGALTGPACDDGLYCTVGDACASGACAGTPRDCSSVADSCNVGTCSESLDSCVPVAANEGGACNDGLFCTVNDVCTAGTCAGPARDCTSAGNACNTGACSESTDACVGIPTNEGGPCSDGLYCTVGDVCTAGACGGAARDCSAAGDICNTGVCDEVDNQCEPSPVANGTACDVLFCSLGETCQAGVCTGGTPNCVDMNVCTVDSCNETTDTCSNTTRAIDPGSTVSSTSTDATPLTVCLVAGSQARAVIWADLVDTAGVPITGATVSIGGSAATESTAQAGTYYREITAAATTGTTTLSVVATACGSTVTLTSTVSVTHAAANATDGGLGGCSPSDGNVRVKVIAAETGAPIAGASVLVGASEGNVLEHAPNALFGGASSTATNVATTDAMGFARFYDYGATLAAPVMVTAGAANRAYFTVVDANASDLVLALPLLNPPAPATSAYTNGTATSGGVMPWLPTGCSDVDAGIALPKLQLDFFSSFQIDALFGPERCWDSMNGLVGTVAVPDNLWIPAQSIGPLCLGGSLAQAPWNLTLRNSPPTENLHMVMASAPWADVQAALGGGGIADVLRVLTYRRIGFILDETVSAPMSGRSFAMNETYPNNFVITYSGRPAESDVVGATAGDYVGTNGTGPLFLMGTAVHEWDVPGSSVTIANSDLNAAGAPTMERRLAGVAAMYLDPADPTRTTPPPANRHEAVTTILIRGGAMAPFGTTGGSTTVTNFLGLAGTTFTAPGTFRWENATANGNVPLYSVHELTVRTQRYLPVLSCATDNEVRDQYSVQWIVVKPFGLTCGADECFTLPTLPASFPRSASGVQQKSGFEQLVGSGAACTGSCPVSGEACVDPDGAMGGATSMCMGGAGTSSNPYVTREYEWRLHLYDLELLTTPFLWNAYRFNDRLLHLTHESFNRAAFN